MKEEILIDMFGEGGAEEVLESYCSNSHNNAEETCLECEVIKNNV